MRLPLKHKEESNNERLAYGWSFILVGYICLIMGLSVVAFLKLPKDLYFSDNPEEFIGERAKYDLSSIVSAGSRPVGSYANEVVTVNYLIRKIESIASESIGAYTIETDVQEASGSYKYYGAINRYESIQNVIVKLTPKDSNHTNAVLINSHFDSVMSSPGAGDDGSMVAVMLGILNSLTKSQEAVSYPIIFLFNGDEENGLEASHAFITQHKWVKDIKTFINLDATGVGGKELLFQTGPQNTWLLKYYRKAAKHPFASVLGEEIFDMNIIPSDTDFRIFRDFGKLAGLNFAYISNGYAYHTRLDKFYNVDDGSLQHTGDNILALTKALANAKELDEDCKLEPTGKGVYFDILGVFFIHYSENVGIVINCIVSILSLVVIGFSIWIISKSVDSSFYTVLIQFAYTILTQLGSLIIGAGVVVILAYFIDWIAYPMSWYSQPALIFGLYFCPFLFLSGIVPAIFLDWQFFRRLPLKFSVILFLHAQCVIFIALIFILMAMHYRSTFLITHVVMFYLLAMMINFLPRLHRSAGLWLLPIIICQTIPLVFNSYIMEILYTVLIPISGRIQSNPELSIALCAIAFSLLLFGFIIPIFSIFRHAKLILTILLVIFIVDFILVFTAVGFPYTEETPQRHLVFHSSRARYNLAGHTIARDTVFAAFLYDRHAEITLKDIANTHNLKYHTWETDTPGLQYYRQYYGLFPTYQLDIPNRAKVSLISKDVLPSSSGTYRFTFELDGAAKGYQILLAPLNNNSLIDWSFRLPEEELDYKLEYRANIQFGNSSPPYTFWVVVNVTNPSPITLTLGLHAKYLDESYQSGDGLRRFLELFPKWTIPVGIIASYDVYEF